MIAERLMLKMIVPVSHPSPERANTCNTITTHRRTLSSRQVLTQPNTALAPLGLPTPASWTQASRLAPNKPCSLLPNLVSQLRIESIQTYRGANVRHQLCILSASLVTQTHHPILNTRMRIRVPSALRVTPGRGDQRQSKANAH